MLKVIIADDEKFQREGLELYIPWNDFGMEVVGIASDGDEAFELIKAYSPDIVITDIKMPLMNGLELSKKVREILPKSRIIIISGYEEFEYARSAIELNAYAYILKPINMSKMLNLLEEIASLFRSELQADEEIADMRKQLQESRPLLTERFVKDLVFGFIKEEEAIRKRADYLSLKIPDSGYYVIVIQLEDQDSALPEEKAQWFYINFSKYILDTFDSYF